jgi:hypothetical protein
MSMSCWRRSGAGLAQWKMGSWFPPGCSPTDGLASVTQVPITDFPTPALRTSRCDAMRGRAHGWRELQVTYSNEPITRSMVP